MKVKISKRRQILRAGIFSLRPLAWDGIWTYHPRVIKASDKLYMVYTGKSIARGISHSIGVAVNTGGTKWEKQAESVLKGTEESWDSDFTAHAYLFKEKENYFALYDGSTKGLWKEYIGLAESKDLLNWTKAKNPILKPTRMKWESHHVSRASVFRHRKKYYIFYSGHDGQNERIGVAYGKSLSRLVRMKNNPIVDLGKRDEFDLNNVADPLVFPYKNKFLMFYSGMDSKFDEHIGLAISYDLHRWRKYEKNPILSPRPKSWDGSGASRFDLIRKNENSYVLYYSGRGNKLWSIGTADLNIND